MKKQLYQEDSLLHRTAWRHKWSRKKIQCYWLRNRPRLSTCKNEARINKVINIDKPSLKKKTNRNAALHACLVAPPVGCRSVGIVFWRILRFSRYNQLCNMLRWSAWKVFIFTEVKAEAFHTKALWSLLHWQPVPRCPNENVHGSFEYYLPVYWSHTSRDNRCF